MGNLCIKSDTNSRSKSSGSKCYNFKCTSDTPNAGVAGCWINIESKHYKAISNDLLKALADTDVSFLNPVNNTSIDKTKILQDFSDNKIGFKFFKTESAFEIEYESLQKLNSKFTTPNEKKTLETCTALYQEQNVNGFIITSDNKFTLTTTKMKTSKSSEREVTTNKAYVIMYKNCYYNLREMLLKNKSKFNATKFLNDIRPFMKKLHSVDLEHLDLKLENIVYCPNNGYRIIDFAFAITETQKEFQMSLDYMLPHILFYKVYPRWAYQQDIRNAEDTNLFRIQQQVFNTIDTYIEENFKNLHNNAQECKRQIDLWPEKTDFSRWIFRKTDDYAIALILYKMCGPEITKETYFKELISAKPYFDDRPLVTTSTLMPSDVNVTVAGSRRSKSRPSSYKKHRSIKINGKMTTIYIGARGKDCIKAKKLYIQLN